MSDIAMGARQAYQETPRWMLVLLIGSLAANFLVIGLAAGAFWRFRGPPPIVSVAPNLLGYASTLSQERRKTLWDQTEAERAHLRPFRREVRTAREDTLKALMQEPFDQQKFVEAQNRQADTEHSARTAVQELYVKIASVLTPEERRAFSHWRERMRPPGSNLLDEEHMPAGAK
jgi:uncharacterized membrane protein